MTKVKVYQWQRAGAAYSLVAPAMLLLMVFGLLPIVYVAFLSLEKYVLPSPGKFTGLNNYIHLVHDNLFWVSLRNTVEYTTGSGLIGLTVALLIALVLVHRIPGHKFFKVIFFIPAVTSDAVIAILFLWIVDGNFGLLNYFISIFGHGKVMWLGTPGAAMWIVILVGAWKGASYNLPLFLAALDGIPKQLYEAASLDGAFGLKRLMYITLPLLKPILTYNITMAIIGSFQMIAYVDLLTNGGPNNSTLVAIQYIWRQAFAFSNLGYASAISLAILPVILVATTIQFKFSK